MSVHRIRLRRPWQFEVQREAVRFRRSFHEPTGLEAGDRVWVVIDGPGWDGHVELNGKCMGQLDAAQRRQRFEVTGLLEPTNTLTVVLHSRQVPDRATAGEPPASVWLEIESPGE